MERVPLGLPDVDQALSGGLERGRLLVVSGPVGCGKSALLYRSALQAAAKGRPVLLAALDGDSFAPRLREQNLLDWGADGALAGASQLMIVEPAPVSASDLSALVAARECELLIIDSVASMLANEQAPTAWARVSGCVHLRQVLTELRALAAELGLAVIAAEAREPDRAPQLPDLLELSLAAGEEPGAVSAQLLTRTSVSAVEELVLGPAGTIRLVERLVELQPPGPRSRTSALAG